MKGFGVKCLVNLTPNEGSTHVCVTRRLEWEDECPGSAPSCVRVSWSKHRHIESVNMMSRPQRLCGNSGS